MSLAVVERIRTRNVVSETRLPISPIEEAIQGAVSAFEGFRADSISPLEYKNPFGAWKEITADEAKDRIGEHLDTSDRNSRRLDACRGIDGISVVVFEGRKHNALGVQVKATTRLGDGKAFHTPGEGWEFNQRKGVYQNTNQLLIRQIK